MRQITINMEVQHHKTYLIKSIQTIIFLIKCSEYDDVICELESIETYLNEADKLRIKDMTRTRDFDAIIVFLNELLVAEQVERQQWALRRKDEDDIAGLITLRNLYKIELSAHHFKKAELQRLINQYRIRHHNELGDMISRILQIRQELLFKQLQKNPDLEDKYQEAQHDYQQFHNSYIEANKRPIVLLSEVQKRDLQKLFRAASKLCHPDLMSDESKTHAGVIFSELHNAYSNHNLQRVKEILQALEKNEFHLIVLTESVSIKQQIEAENAKLVQDLQRIKREIAELENSDVHIAICDILDWDTYFAKLKTRFITELDKLEEQMAAL